MPHIHELIDFTTSAFILHPSDSKILLLHHVKLNRWLQPGGHVELNENPLQALHHELEEETGLLESDYDFVDQPEQPLVSNSVTLPIPFHINEHSYDDSHKHIDLAYLLKAKIDKITDDPDGAIAISWLTLAEIRNLHSKGMIFDGTLDVCEWITNKHL